MRSKTSRLISVALGFLAASSLGAQEHRELRLVLIDLAGVSPTVKGALVRETRHLLLPAGVTLHNRLAGVAEERDASELAVILLPEQSRAPSRGASRLGAVQTTVGFTTIWIDVNAVAAVADAPRGLDCCGVPMRRLSLALGRVLTHELVHFMDPSLGHARRGLMAARVTRETLVDDVKPLAPLLFAKRPNSQGIN